MPPKLTIQQILAKGTPVSQGNGSSPPPPPVPQQSVFDKMFAPNADRTQKIQSEETGALPLAGSIVGGIGGAALGGLATTPTVLGVPAGAYAGGVAGATAGAAAGTSLQELIQGKKQSPGAIATQGAEYGAAEAIEIPGAKAAEPFVKAGIDAATPVIKKGIDSTLGLIGRGATATEKKIVGALTPILKPTELKKGITAAASQGEKFDASATTAVQKSYQAVKDAASALGKRGSDIIKTGVKKAEANVARIGGTIKEYAQKVVSPFIQKSGASYNFADLKSALNIIKPSGALSEEETAAWTKVKNRVLQAIADKVGPEVKNISSITGFRRAADEAGNIPAKVSKGDEDFWDARKIIDGIVEEESKGKAWGDAKLTGAKAAYRDLREGFQRYLSDAYRYPGQMEKVNAANDFLATQQTKSMDKTGWNLQDFEKQFGLERSSASDANANEWEHHMSTMHSLYDAMSNVTTRAVKESGKTWSELYKKAHPLISRMVGGAATVVGGGAVYETAKEAGIPLP